MTTILDRFRLDNQVAIIEYENGVRATRIAHGVPVGGELEFVDSGTLAHAFAGRQAIG